jgi:hypothetical protein
VPLLKDVKIKYANEQVDIGSLVMDSNEMLFDGGEMALIGKIKDGADEVPIVAQISAISTDGPIELTVYYGNYGNFVSNNRHPILHISSMMVLI